MKQSKKGISGYIITLLGTSFALTLLFLMVFNIIYQQENPGCMDIKFDIDSICLDGSTLKFKVANRAQSPLDFLINGGNQQGLVIGESKVFTVDAEGLKDIKISPMISIRDEIYFCKSKNSNIDVWGITKTC